ncbi:MAG: FGGY-family carbohydrate kinase [Actinomycetes bacterium]
MAAGAASQAGDDDVVLAIDVGTTGLKAAYVALTGTVIDSAQRQLPATRHSGDSAVQNPDDWWSGATSAAGELAQRAKVSPERIIAVACTGQWGSTVPVGADGVAAGEAMMWLDYRGRELSGAQLGGPFAVDGYRPRAALEWIRRAGGAPSPEGNDPLGHRLWIEHRDADLYARTAHFVEPVDYLNLRLTGIVAATQATMTLSWLTDNRKLDATGYDPVLVKLAGADPSRLPRLLPTRSVVGKVQARVADQIGVRAGTPVVAGLPDLHSAAIGSGACKDFQGHISLSTSAWTGAHTRAKRTSMKYQMATVPAGLPGRYVLANNHDSAGSAMQWLQERIVSPDDGLGRGQPTLPDLDQLASTIPAGAGGVMFVPWLQGERTPVADTAMRGSFLNMGLNTDRGDLVRAVLEGVAHQMRWITESSEKVLRHPLTDLRLVGGGAQSDVWCQIHADVLGRPVHRVEQPIMAAVRGAAMFAAMTLGRIQARDIPGRIPLDRTFRPTPDLAALYDLRHREFVKVHKSQRDLYHHLNL